MTIPQFPGSMKDPTGQQTQMLMQQLHEDRMRELGEVAREGDARRALGKQWGPVRGVLATVALPIVLLAIILLYWQLVIR